MKTRLRPGPAVLLGCALLLGLTACGKTRSEILPPPPRTSGGTAGHPANGGRAGEPPSASGGVPAPSNGMSAAGATQAGSSGSAGRWSHTVDTDCDQTPDSCTYYAELPQRRYQVGPDLDCDGTPDGDCHLYAEDDTWSAADSNCDGEPDGACLHRNSGATHVAWRQDADCDGEPERCRRYEYDTNNLEILDALDEGCDGQPDTCVRSTRHPDGRLSSAGTDDACDGGIDRDCVEVSYLPSGWHHVQRSPNCDAVWSDCYLAQGANGEPVSRRGDDANCDGEVDDRCLTRFENIEGGWVEGWDDGCDGDLDEDCQRVEAFDTLSEAGADDDCDGTFDHSCSVTNYDDQYRIESTYADPECDGEPYTDCTAGPPPKVPPPPI